jgi:hypothetical protein
MIKNNVIINFLLATLIMSCHNEAKHRKQFYSNFNFVTLKPIGVSKDTLIKVPYIKIDTLKNQFLRVCLVTDEQEDTFIYEKYGSGWLKRDTCCETQGYDFKLYNGFIMIAYSYRQSLLQNKAFNLVNLTIEQANYDTDSYLFGLYNQNKIYSSCDFNLDTSFYQFRVQKRVASRADTLCKTTSYYTAKTQEIKSDTFCFLKKVPFEFFYHLYTEPFFKQIIE